ncbi:MAG: stage III sporulation protein AA [Firmicutes bacterium]|nr:stage III sporulation protein AA [Bacillota bacterium]
MNYSYYAYEEELRNGYITLFGGHRAGICGHAVVDNGKISTISNFSSINIRQAREYIGISSEFVNKYYKDNLCDVLIVSPPGCGKTTFLRDMVRTLSFMEFNVGVCDERSEIAGMFQGKPSFEIGPNTDVLDSCPKAEGMKMLLRSMGPDIIVTDEIGKSEDIEAIITALTSGTRIIATAHGDSIERLKHGPLKEVIDYKLFNIILFLDRNPYPCTIKSIMKLK